MTYSAEFDPERENGPPGMPQESPAHAESDTNEILLRQKARKMLGVLGAPDGSTVDLDWSPEAKRYLDQLREAGEL